MEFMKECKPKMKMAKSQVSENNIIKVFSTQDNLIVLIYNLTSDS